MRVLPGLIQALLIKGLLCMCGIRRVKGLTWLIDGGCLECDGLLGCGHGCHWDGLRLGHDGSGRLVDGQLLVGYSTGEGRRVAGGERGRVHGAERREGRRGAARRQRPNLRQERVALNGALERKSTW